jgi:hypothetical protein
VPSFSVRFKGMLTGTDREQLAAANIEIAGSEPSMTIGTVRIGRPIYTTHVEAASPEDALARVRAALEPDTGNFVDWEASS